MPLRGRTGVDARPHMGRGKVGVSVNDLAYDLVAGDDSRLE
jgi:hypothetical protein